ncbi:carbohydrate binding family 9 domain-containing protein [Emticicia sp. BO119]|uniref:carbohydrate binding family 9 domain-containing protein n=1 Tax=Emticicia sp. BO119 TaxID=2757768 RepID=UPI0015F11698|nr:carbohydrate binding family 9 domain-containing protein [Emticicia sp. BO119]MBA4853972.1 carbohydrate binding family 9 domain-containing protein [Emticicia sp. BO119]
MKKLYATIGAILCVLSSLSAQDNKTSNEEKYSIHIKKSAAPIKLDGLLDEEIWKTADVAKDFFLNRPYDSSFAQLQTEVRLAFDDNFLYVGAICYQPRSTYTIASLKRDFEPGTSDVFVVNLDTFKDRLNAFQFVTNPYGVQREGLIYNGGEISNYWDNKWYLHVKNYEEYWVVEMAIPFKTIRYKVIDEQNTWRINFTRNVLKRNEQSSWSPVPRNFAPSNLAFTGLMIWDEKPPKPGANVSVIPYISLATQKDFPRNEEDLSPSATSNAYPKGIGLDAKVAVTPSLNLDLTVNPDFSQVEVDKQVTNLSRFELFFPERRQFFLENNDLFGTFGFPDTRPFFSRRIGITRNPNTGLNQQVPILAGARLSGKLNDKWRIGLMNMQTRKVNFGNDTYLPAANYSVATIQRKIFNRSTIGGIFTDKENLFSDLTEQQILNYRRFNRVGGLEFNYYSKDSRFEIETYYHQSFSPDGKKDAASAAHFMGYHHPHVDLNFGVQRIGENYRADIGFVPRTGIWQLYRPATFILNPKSKSIAKYINAYGIGTEGSDVFDLKGKRLDSESNIFVFANNSAGDEAYIAYSWSFTHLFASFDPTNASDNPDPDTYRNVVELPIGDYRSRFFNMGYTSSRRYSLTGTFDYSTGKYFNGKATIWESSIAYRFQPYGIFTFDCNYTKINLPAPYNSVQYWLLGPRAELAVSKSLFFSTFFQYNTQTNNININSRLQWRFRPVSDIFLVYTDNYFAENISRYYVNAWAPKNRALILKMTYWLNI